MSTKCESNVIGEFFYVNKRHSLVMVVLEIRQEAVRSNSIYYIS